MGHATKRTQSCAQSLRAVTPDGGNFMNATIARASSVGVGPATSGRVGYKLATLFFPEVGSIRAEMKCGGETSVKDADAC